MRKNCFKAVDLLLEIWLKVKGSFYIVKGFWVFYFF